MMLVSRSPHRQTPTSRGLALTDIRMTFITAELDGDVLGLGGYTYFNNLISHPGRVYDVQFACLGGANHDAFMLPEGTCGRRDCRRPKKGRGT